MDKKNFLELNIRSRIFDYIKNFPGKHIRELSRDLNISKTTLAYQLNILEKRDLIFSDSKITNLRYYPNEKISRKNRKILH